MASRKGSSAEAMEAAAADQPRDVSDYFNPVHEWLSEDGHYILRLNLPGFKKEDFRVHVDKDGRLTIRGQRLADGGAGSVWLHKVFLLPPTSDLDGIAGRFVGGELTITVPMLPPGAVPPPQATEEEKEEDVADKPTDQKAKVDSDAERRIEAARAALASGRHREEEEEEKQTGRSKKPPAKKVDEVGEEPKAVATATPSEKAAKREDEDDKARAEHRAKVGREAERRIEAARKRLAEAEREREKGRWKEHEAEEGFKWAEAIGKNKEVIAAVAAVALGVFVLHKLFSKD